MGCGTLHSAVPVLAEGLSHSLAFPEVNSLFIRLRVRINKRTRILSFNHDASAVAMAESPLKLIVGGVLIVNKK